MANTIHSIKEAIGNTPIAALHRFSALYGLPVPIHAKLEMFNPCGSVKDRVGFALLEDGEERGLIHEGTVVIEPTSGNTGIGLAFCASLKGYRLILTMPETMSEERKGLLRALGAELVLTPGDLGMQGAIDKAQQLSEAIEGAYIPGQFTNPANVQVHRNTTAKEILRDFDETIDYFVAGIGSGGTITGVGEVLKQFRPATRVVGVEPETSAVLSGGLAGLHLIQGIGAGFIPSILNVELLDEIVTVSGTEAMDCARRLYQSEGILAGISSGAALAACIIIARRHPNTTVLTLLPDTGTRYLSMGLFS